MQYELTDQQAAYLLGQVENDIFAMHNSIAAAVENPKHWESHGGAERIVRDLRRAEEVRMVFRRHLYPMGEPIESIRKPTVVGGGK